MVCDAASSKTPSDLQGGGALPYLTLIAPISHTAQFVEAVLPQPWKCKHLAIARSEPCLLIRRRTWSADQIVTSVRLLYPGTRYRLESSS
ncbi:UTRA domain-containing protein [Neorhizobium sp. R1-B]|uniref:UTRA domain-containing protein n=1 Tax=Neorhizobium sp. R1-B TaxID=2485162 RepID=UPI002479F6F7|nr:UTRA domain-containing protein [Neorhizobium sp. R1-B]